MAVHIIKGGRIIDPASGTDKRGHLVIDKGRVAAILAPNADLSVPEYAGADIFDATGLAVTPGFIDLHVHFREPGEEYKETFASGTRAAAQGGFTTVQCMPNTKPPIDTMAIAEAVLRKSADEGAIKVMVAPAMTRGLKGKEICEYSDYAALGCKAITDDGVCVMDAGVMRRVFEHARGLGLLVMQHAEDHCLSGHGAMHEGEVATRLGLPGIPSCAESIIVERDIALAELTGARYHVCHISTKAAIDAVRRAKARKLPVSAEVTPHHLVLTDAAVGEYDTRAKMSPPLREIEDVKAARKALADGTIEAVATDHAPHTSLEKDVEFEHAANGVIGLETALPVLLRLVDEGVLDLPAAIERLTAGPARLLGIPAGTLAVGTDADVCVFDLERRFKIETQGFASKSRNSPFEGWEVRGRVLRTYVRGRVVHKVKD